MEGEEKEKKDAGPATRLDIPFRRERDEIRSGDAVESREKKTVAGWQREMPGMKNECTCQERRDGWRDR